MPFTKINFLIFLFFSEECPPGTSARKKIIKKSKHPNAVIERVTLKPFCRSCPLGHFQPNYGQTKCIPCPKYHTTNQRASTSPNQCVPTVQEVCLNSKNLCNKGRCVTEDDFYYTCICDDGHVGTHCEIPINACNSNPCLNGGICMARETNLYEFNCVCKVGFKGKYCEEEEEKCPIMCVNGGNCVQDENNMFMCVCPEGYGGDLCETKMQYCKYNLCENEGECIEKTSGYSCLCKNGFIGMRCNIKPCDYKPCRGNFLCVNLLEVNATRLSFE